MGRVRVFLQLIEAEFRNKIFSPGDENVLNGVSTNLLRVANDFYWGSFICSFLNSEGELSEEKENEIEPKIKKLLKKRVIKISDNL